MLEDLGKDIWLLWHLGFEQLNFGDLELLSKNRMIRGLPFIIYMIQFYEGCLLEKHSRKNFTKAASTRTNNLL